MAPFSRIPVCFPWVQSRWWCPSPTSLLTSQCIRDSITRILSPNLRTLWLRSYITSILQMRKLRHGKPKFLPGSLNGPRWRQNWSGTWPRVWRAELINECAQSLSCVQLLAILWTVAPQAPLSTGFFRQEYWSGLPFPPPGDLPEGSNLHLLLWQVDSLPLSHLRSHKLHTCNSVSWIALS